MLIYGFKYHFIYHLLIFGIFLIHININGQQKICIGTKTNYWVDKDKLSHTKETYSWHVNSSDFRGTINILNSIGNQIEIDWKNSKVGKYVLEVSKSNICSSSKSELEIYLEDKINFDMSTLYYLCPNHHEIVINAPPGYKSYNWLNEYNETLGKNSSIKIYSKGKYKLEVSDGECLGILDFVVDSYEFPTINIINQNTHTIHIQMNQDTNQFLYQLIDINNKIIKDWQSKSIFENIGKGNYIVKIKSNISDCITDLSTEVLAIPNVITPNGDGFNDFWDLRTYQNIKEIHIFDRFGKKIIILNSDFNWNGKVSGKSLPSTTYWYQIILTNGQKIYGDLLIKN